MDNLEDALNLVISLDSPYEARSLHMLYTYVGNHGA